MPTLQTNELRVNPLPQSCESKRRYSSLMDALAACNAATRRGQKHMGVYWCEHHHCYHCGHVPARMRP